MVVEKKFPIKGLKEGLLIKVGEGNWKDVQTNLLDQIDERIDFFKGAKIALDLGERIMRAAEMGCCATRCLIEESIFSRS